MSWSFCDYGGEEVVVSCGDLALEAQGVLAGCSSGEIQGDVLEGGEVGGGVVDP